MELHEAAAGSDSTPIATTPPASPASRLSRAEELRSQSSSPGSGTHLSSTSGVSLGEAIVQRAKQGMESWYQLPAEGDVSRLTAASVTRLDQPSWPAEEHTAPDSPPPQAGMISTADEARQHQAKEVQASQLAFQDSRLSPALPLLPGKATSLPDDTFFQQTGLEFAPLRGSPDISVMSERFARPLQMSDAIQLAITEVSEDFPGDHPSLSQHPLAVTTVMGDDASSMCSLSQHTLSPSSTDEGVSNCEKAPEEEMEEDRFSRLQVSLSRAEEQQDPAAEKHASSVASLLDKVVHGPLEDDGSFLNSDVPAPLLLELLEKEVGLSSSGTSSSTSGNSSSQIEVVVSQGLNTGHSEHFIEESVDKDIAPDGSGEDSVVPKPDLSRSSLEQESFRVSRDLSPGKTSFSSTKPAENTKDKAELNESDRCEKSNITTRSSHTKSYDELSDAPCEQLCSESIFRPFQSLSDSRKVQKDPLPPNSETVTPNTGSLGTYSGKDSIITAVPTGIGKTEISLSSGFSCEKGQKETELSNSGSHMAVEGSFLGSLAQPISHSTPGVIAGIPRASVQPASAKLSPIESNLEASAEAPHCSSSDTGLAPSSLKDVEEPTRIVSGTGVVNVASHQTTRKIHSLPALNYMEKVGAWNVTQSTGKTFFDHLALKGFTGVSPKKKAYDAIADSLNHIFSQQKSDKTPLPSTSNISSRSPRRNLAASFSGTSSPAKETPGSAGGLGRSLSYTSVSTVAKEVQQAGAPECAKMEESRSEFGQKKHCASAEEAASTSVAQDSSADRSAHMVVRKNVSESYNVPLLTEPLVLSEKGLSTSTDKDRCCTQRVKQGKLLELENSSQPPSQVSLGRFSDVSASQDLSNTLASSQDTVPSYRGQRRQSASTGAVSVSSPVSLEVDNYAPYWATNPSTPARNKELNIEERIPMYLQNLGIDQSPSTILTPFVPKGPIREPEFSPTDLRTIKGSTGTPTKSTQPSEGGSPAKGDFSQSSLFSVNSTSLSVPLSSDVDRESPLHAESSVQNVAESSSDKPVSQCSLQTAFHPLDRSLDLRGKQPSDDTSQCKETISAEPFSSSEARQRLNGNSDHVISSRVQKRVSQFQPGEMCVTPDSLSSSSSLAENEQQTGPQDTEQKEAYYFPKVTHTPPRCSLDLGNDSFVGTKTLQEIRKLLGQAESIVSGRSSFSSPSASLRGSEDLSSFLQKNLDSFHDSLASSEENHESHSSLLWRKSSSDSMLTLDGLKGSSWQEVLQSPRASASRSVITAEHERVSSVKTAESTFLSDASKEFTQGRTCSVFTAKNVRRSEPEGCSEATQDKVVSVPGPVAHSTEASIKAVDAGDRHRDPTPELALPNPSVNGVPAESSHSSDGREGARAAAGEDSSSVDSLAGRVAALLKNESPATVASGVVSEADEEERRARDWIKLKVSGEQCEPLELNMEDRQKIEEIKAELLRNTKKPSGAIKGQWSTDTDSDTTSSTVAVTGVLPSLKPTEEFCALNTAKHQISSQLQKLSSNPFNTSVELHTPLRKDMEARIREIAQREGLSASQQVAHETGRPIVSITFSSRKRSPSPASLSPLLSRASDVADHTSVTRDEDSLVEPVRLTELDRRQAGSLQPLTATKEEVQKVRYSHQGPGKGQPYTGKCSGTDVEDAVSEVENISSTQRPVAVSESGFCSNNPVCLRNNACTGQGEVDSLTEPDVNSGKDDLTLCSTSGYGFHHYQLGFDAHVRSDLKPPEVCGSQTEEQRQGSPGTTNDSPFVVLQHAVHKSPGAHFHVNATRYRQLSTSTPNIALEENASASLKPSALPLQVSSFASGSSSVSSPTKKVLSYVHVTLSPKPSNEKSMSTDDRHFQFGTFPPESDYAEFLKTSASENPSDTNTPSAIQGHSYTDGTQSTEGIYDTHSPITGETSHVRGRVAQTVRGNCPESTVRQEHLRKNQERYRQHLNENMLVGQMKPRSADASAQITTHVPGLSSESTRPSSTLSKSRSPAQQPQDLPVQTSAQPVLVPYKPRGSQKVFYIPQSRAQVSQTHSDTTMESSHPGSDDAIPPKFTVEILGARNKEVDIDVTAKHKEGIYSKTAQSKTRWEENTGSDIAFHRQQRLTEYTHQGHSRHPIHCLEYQGFLEKMSADELHSKTTAQNRSPSFSGTFSKGASHPSEEHRRPEREFSREHLAFSRKHKEDKFSSLEGEVDYTMKELHLHQGLERENLTSTRASWNHIPQENPSPLSRDKLATKRNLDNTLRRGDQVSSEHSLHNSNTLDELWEKFKARQSLVKLNNPSGKERSLLERLDRLSRLLHNPCHHSFISERETGKGRDRDHGPQKRKKEEVMRRLRENRESHLQQAWGEESVEPKEITALQPSKTLKPVRDISTASPLSRHLYLAEREQVESVTSDTVSESDVAIQTESGDSSHTETSSTVSTIDTARLIRAFGPQRVNVNPSLNKLYSAIDKQKESLHKKSVPKKRASKSKKHIDTASPSLCSTEESTVMPDSVSASTCSVPVPRGPSGVLTNKKTVKLLNKGIQAGDLEIVNSGTKKNTRDVGVTFPSPGSAWAEQTGASRHMEARRDERTSSNSQQFLYEKKTKKSNPQRHTQGMSWFVPADELKSEAKKENQPSSVSGPGPAWFEPYTRAQPWREPLREKQVQDAPVPSSRRSRAQPITEPGAGAKWPTSLVRITLQEALAMCRPDFISRSRERMKRLVLLAEERRTQAVFDSEREDLFNQLGTRRAWGVAHPNRQPHEELHIQKKRAIPKKEMFIRSKQNVSLWKGRKAGTC
ncbi:centrosome-associated protein ALMS1 isoform X2 [Lepisosteus oculatus]|uniref:centrosome-associated protein ALMS1 isoform X2 n=1 Tax=Lepisosteus oculatus TaxID=7918 RepID=UPI0035F5144D